MDEVTTRVAFAANDKIRFEEDYSIVSVYSIDIEGTVWCADGPTWFNKSTSFATFGGGGINDESALSAAGWAKSSSGNFRFNSDWAVAKTWGCGGSFACLHGGSTGSAYIEKALPDSSGIVVVRWGSFDDGGSNDEGCELWVGEKSCLLYTSPSPRDQRGSRMPSSA